MTQFAANDLVRTSAGLGTVITASPTSLWVQTSDGAFHSVHPENVSEFRIFDELEAAFKEFSVIRSKDGVTVFPWVPGEGGECDVIGSGDSVDDAVIDLFTRLEVERDEAQRLSGSGEEGGDMRDRRRGDRSIHTTGGGA